MNALRATEIKLEPELNCLIQKVDSSMKLFPARPDGTLNIYPPVVDDFIENIIDSITETCVTNTAPSFVLFQREAHHNQADLARSHNRGRRP